MSIYFEGSLIYKLKQASPDAKDIPNADVLLVCFTLNECRKQRQDLHRIIRGLLDAAMSGNMKNMLPVIDAAKKILEGHRKSGEGFDL